MTLIYPFSAKHCLALEKGQIGADKNILGGKGAGLVTMIEAGMNVPPGFTITTVFCNQYAKLPSTAGVGGQDFYANNLIIDAVAHWKALAKQFGYQPLVSVRSGAPISMPGMMDTILNVGINDDNLQEWISKIGHRAALDSYRRLIQMLGSTAYDIDMKHFDEVLATAKTAAKVTEDKDLDVTWLMSIINGYKQVFKGHAGLDFPQDPEQQLSAAIMAVFRSWMNPRAIEYRKINKISADLGTACTVQAMVFGNMGDDSGTGVLFTRDPSTGQDIMMGEFLQNAQGEDVVAGIRTPMNVNQMPDVGGVWTGIFDQLHQVCADLEKQYKDMVDLEFTVQQGELFILQSRTGKRSAQAAFKIAYDLHHEGVIDKGTALKRLSAEQFKIVRRPRIDAKFKGKPNYIGLAASPGVVKGVPAFSAAQAVKLADVGQDVILVTHETNPDDIAGMAKAVGILTQTGGATSHAAVVARAMDKACVVGCTDLPLGSTVLTGAKVITIDGSTGRVWIDVDVPVVDSSDNEEIATVMSWCVDRLGVMRLEDLVRDDMIPHRVSAAAWWDDDVVLGLVMDDLYALQDRSHISIDMRGPKQFMMGSDAMLGNCFGPVKDNFAAVLHDTFFDNRDKLAGLTLINSNYKPEAADKLKAAGVMLYHSSDMLEAGPGVAVTAVPAEYAAFTVLGQ